MSSYPPGIPEDICDLFERLALTVASAGFERYSARAIMHRMRWHMQVEQGDRDFKCNNNWTPGLSRWFMKKNRGMAGFFETRRSNVDAA